MTWFRRELLVFSVLAAANAISYVGLLLSIELPFGWAAALLLGIVLFELDWAIIVHHDTWIPSESPGSVQIPVGALR